MSRNSSLGAFGALFFAFFAFGAIGLLVMCSDDKPAPVPTVAAGIIERPEPPKMHISVIPLDEDTNCIVFEKGGAMAVQCDFEKSPPMLIEPGTIQPPSQLYNNGVSVKPPGIMECFKSATGEPCVKPAEPEKPPQFIVKPHTSNRSESV